MDLVTGAMGNLVPKLLQLLQDEYKLQKSVREQVQYLGDELSSMHVALCKVAQVPFDQLDPQVKLWASQVREASYDMEDVIDIFLVRVDGGDHQPADRDADEARVKRLRVDGFNNTEPAKSIVTRLLEKLGNLLFSLSSIKARHDITVSIEEIKKQVDEIAKRRDRYRVNDHVASSSATTTSIDPRVLTFHTKASEIVGIDEPRDELIMMLTLGDDDDDDDASNKNMKIVFVVGAGGLGKTTLAKVVYEKLTADMNIHCKAFVPVSQKPDLKKVFRDILFALGAESYMNRTNFMVLDEIQLIAEIRDFLKEKRYFIVIDDVWEVPSWNAIRIALEDNNSGSKAIITTRCSDVAELVHGTYKMKPLPPDRSKILFHRRIFGSQDKCSEILSELSDKILKKCGGVPLAIITVASLLANKSDNIAEWQEVCTSIGSGLSSSNDMYNDMRKILALSYYDLPPHMKTCFIYLSIYPEDYEIERNRLIWRWISEGFIQPQKHGDDLFELGKSYFNDLINRSLVQPVGSMDSIQGIYACHVHDMILDLICSLSREENFVTTSDDMEHMMSSNGKRLRRLSLKNSAWPKTGLSQVRSIAIFRPSIDSVPSFSCFDMLRVLDLEGCSLKGCAGGSKMCVGNLIHLRYLGLRGTCLSEPPGGIEKLRFLQVFIMDNTFGSVEFQQSVFSLRRLMRLEGVRCYPRPGNLLRNLACLQELDYLYVDENSAGAVGELGHLTQLKVLEIEINLQMDQTISDALINSLGNLPRLQRLSIWHDPSLKNDLINWDRWVPPPHLCKLCMIGDILLNTLPGWISSASLPQLTWLDLSVVRTVRPEDIQIIGALPNLLWLYLQADSENFMELPLQKFVVSADAFPRATHCFFHNFVIVPSMFTRGAMLRVQEIQFCFRTRDFFSSGGLEFSNDLAMEHLPSLQQVTFSVHGKTDVGEEEMARVREATKHAGDAHPKHPSIFIL